MLPTQLLLHLRLPRWRGLVEVITLLPLVFPPIVLVVGVSDVYRAAPPASAARGHDEQPDLRPAALHPRRQPPAAARAALRVLAMPFVYRALDAGIRSIDAADPRRGGPQPRRRLGHGAVPRPRALPAHRDRQRQLPVLRAGDGRVHDLLDPALHQAVPGLAGAAAHQSGQVQAAVSVFSLLLVEVVLLLLGACSTVRRNRQKRA